jgi:ferric-dicitrate binding protein FerR (iron transport regulator)
MKNKDWEKKAEDNLNDDFLVEGLKEENQSADPLIEDKYKLVSKIRYAVSENSSIFDDSEKELLGKRIIQTIHRHKRRNLIISISTAAVFLLLMGIATIITVNKESEISVFARNNQSVPLSGNTRLILSGEEEIQINSAESKIAYAGNGKEIQIDSNHVRQVVEDNKMVYNTVIVPYGKRTQITLSDNSSVWLNSGSKLIYPARFATEKREVYLEGEAIFEVSHNKQQPFMVITHDIEVKVLGTVFDISTYTDDATSSTILESGSVEMKYNNNSLLSSAKVKMVPGMMAVYDPIEKTIKQTQVNTKLYTSWREGYFVFERQSLGEILKKISRYYNVTIQLNDQSLADETFTGPLDLRNSATQVLEIIAELINAKVENIDNQIIITRI